MHNELHEMLFTIYLLPAISVEGWQWVGALSHPQMLGVPYCTMLPNLCVKQLLPRAVFEAISHTKRTITIIYSVAMAP